MLTKEAERRLMPGAPGEEPDPMASDAATVAPDAAAPAMASVPVTTGTVALPPLRLQKPAELTKTHAEAGG